MKDLWNRFPISPSREFYIAALLLMGLFDSYVLSNAWHLILPTAIIGSIIPLAKAWEGVRKGTITIELFNFLALTASFATGNIDSASFIALMLTFASYLDWRTQSRASNAVEELLKLKPNKAYRERGDTIEEIPSEKVTVGDVLVVRTGERIPVDGTIVFGDALINEASVTGESRPVEKLIGDEVFSGTLSESSVIKIRATKESGNSTIERMAELIKGAAAQKSKTQRLADRFAGIFLPIVAVLGVLTYFISGSISMTVAFFLVVCADDIAVSIPLAVTASLGRAAKRGVIIKGGEWLDVLAKVNILVFDKTGTLTYGDFRVAETFIVEGFTEVEFWQFVGIAEKFSEHPVGRAIFKVAKKHSELIPDPDSVIVHKGAGVAVMSGTHSIVVGNEKILEAEGLIAEDSTLSAFALRREAGNTVMMVYIDKEYRGMLSITDTPRTEAAESIRGLQALGIRVIMLTGDNEGVAREVSSKLGITEFRAGVTPEGKLREIEALSKEGILAMVGDGVNDAPALARANIGLAMGTGGTAVAVEAANVIILTDQLDRILEMIHLSRRTVSIVRGDILIWFVTNALGIALVFTGFFGPALAAFYNFATDFLPLLNSLRLFKNHKQ